MRCMAWPSCPPRWAPVSHGPAVCVPGNFDSRQGDRGGQADRLPAPGFAPHFAPRTDRFGVTPYGRDPQNRAELRYCRAGSQDPRPCSCLHCKRSEAMLHPSKYATDLRKHEAEGIRTLTFCCHARGQRSSLVSKYDPELLKCGAKGFEPLTFCMPFMAILSDRIGSGRVTAGQDDIGV